LKIDGILPADDVPIAFAMHPDLWGAVGGGDADDDGGGSHNTNYDIE
jgi:hypothetical protein